MQKTLVVLAAGLGSRFGGLKQITPINEFGLFIIDYSIFDAIKNGFTKVVFIIKEEHADLFKETIGSRISKYIKVDYAYQSIDEFVDKYPDLKKREKPLGTAHALYAVKDKVDTPFVVINADDFNSYQSFYKASEFINNNKDEDIYATVNYPFIQTASKYGSVKRGFVQVENDYVTAITESKVEIKDNKAYCLSLKENKEFTFELNHLVAVNFFVLYPNIFGYLEKYINDFLESSDNRQNNEVLLPELLCDLIKEKKIKLKNIISDGIWSGMTYKEDIIDLQKKIQELENKQIYKRNLWD